MLRPILALQLTVTVSATDYRTFVSAARILRRIMRDAAPDVSTLLASKLTRHDATGIAEDYLEIVGWAASRSTIVLTEEARTEPRRQRRTATRHRRRVKRKSVAIIGGKKPVDPQAN